MQTFFHVDKESKLQPGQVIVPDESGLSLFGRRYSAQFRMARMTFDAPYNSRTRNEITRREYYLEATRRIFVSDDDTIHSRLSSFFCGEDLETMTRIATRMKVRPGCPIFEVETESAVSRHDMTWLDFNFPVSLDKRLPYYQNYWHGRSIDDLSTRPPGVPASHSSLFEVLIPGEVRIGGIAGTT
ncbi:hypothetical protein FJP69_19575 [Stenotrophomonas maltophilia]|nr:hypothetical protein FJP69_19575 [Stenotrophomonas maltophilia]